MDDADGDLLQRVRERARVDAEGAAAGPPDLGIPGLRIRRFTLAGLFGRAPSADRPPPCDHAAVDAAEAALGVTFPPLLRRLYTEVGNGGFGPGDGILGMAGGWRDHHGDTLVELHRSLAGDGGFPDGLVVLCRRDDAVFDCVDTTDPAGPVVEADLEEFEPDEPETWAGAFSPQAPSLRAWLEDWLAGPTAAEAMAEAVREAEAEAEAQYVSPEEATEIYRQWFRDQGLDIPPELQ